MLKLKSSGVFSNIVGYLCSLFEINAISISPIELSGAPSSKRGPRRFGICDGLNLMLKLFRKKPFVLEFEFFIFFIKFNSGFWSLFWEFFCSSFFVFREFVWLALVSDVCIVSVLEELVGDCGLGLRRAVSDELTQSFKEPSLWWSEAQCQYLLHWQHGYVNFCLSNFCWQ